jgi:enterochelin esterase-like enzyme/sugar lactone lactonase YvrE
MRLEAVGAGTTDGTIVSIGARSGQPNQRWLVVPKSDGVYTIRPSYSDTLVFAASRGGVENCTPVVLERESGRPWQEWTIKWDGAGYVVIQPRHAPKMGLDDLGGGKTPGAKQDIFNCDPNDPHLQWRLLPLAGATVPNDMPRAGSIREFTFSESKVFPGTVRKVTVFIPAQYDGSAPACVYVKQDGYSSGEKGMLEMLIAAKEMPVTVGVFVTPGDVPPPEAGQMGRRNRGLEYDGLGDCYARFIAEEILPLVERKYGLKLSNSGNDRCIAGGSSGGICAFNAAWERPDLFSRVYAVSGSFVAFRGGNEFPTLVRKFEAKPIRSYLLTGTHDMENRAGDWYLLDLEMEKALAFSGYDYVFHALEGGHGVGGGEHFMDAMRFLWKGWPEPVHAGPSAPRVRDVILPAEGWQPAASDLYDARSPACNSKGEVLFIDARSNKIVRIGPDGAAAVLVEDARHADGLCVGPKDEIYTVSETTCKIVRYDPDGRKARVLPASVKGRYVVATAVGDLYVSGPRGRTGGDSLVHRVRQDTLEIVDSGLKHAAGLAIRPDRWLLSVADGGTRWVYSYRIAPDGKLADKERYYSLHVGDADDDAGAGSVCFSRENQMFVATRIGIQICADDGPTTAILPTPDRARVTGVCLGGPDLTTLFAFTPDKIWKRKVKVHAVGAFSPPVPVGATPL